MAENKMVEAITSMDTDFAQWYTDICKKAELVEYTSVKGCMVIRPYGYAIWENIQHILDGMFKATGHENVCMPMFSPESLLEKEKRKFEKEGNMKGQPDLEKYRMLVGAYLKPEINPEIVGQLNDSGIVPPFGYLVNRGLGDATRRLAQDSKLGVKIYTDKIPFEGNSFEAGKVLDIDPISAAMNGGDDFRLLFVIPMLKYETFRHDFQTFSIIGHLAKQDVGAVLVTPEGAELPIKAQGWNNDEEI